MNRVIPCLNYFFEKLSGAVPMINGLCRVKVLRGGILVILFDSCVLEGKLIALSMHGLVKSSKAAHFAFPPLSYNRNK